MSLVNVTLVIGQFSCDGIAVRLKKKCLTGFSRHVSPEVVVVVSGLQTRKYMNILLLTEICFF